MTDTPHSHRQGDAPNEGPRVTDIAVASALSIFMTFRSRSDKERMRAALEAALALASPDTVRPDTRASEVGLSRLRKQRLSTLHAIENLAALGGATQDQLKALASAIKGFCKNDPEPLPDTRASEAGGDRSDQQISFQVAKGLDHPGSEPGANASKGVTAGETATTPTPAPPMPAGVETISKADIERVARAICKAEGDDPDELVDDCSAWLFHTSTARAAIAAFRATPPASPQGVPLGWKLVPEELTEEMRDAAVKGSRADISYNDIDELWPVVLQSTTTPPASPRPSQKPGADVPDGAAARDVLAERRRQVEVEGWTAEHDDGHDPADLSRAALSYVSAASLTTALGFQSHKTMPPLHDLVSIAFDWPWELSAWKPSSVRRNLVKAGALILAEIERLDRLAARATP